MFALNLEAHGLKLMQKRLKMLEKVCGGKAYKAVELRPKQRKDGDHTNAEIMKFLAEQGRDFRHPDSKELDEIGRAFIKEIETKFKTLAEKTNVEKAAKNVSGLGFREAMKVYMASTTERIEEAIWKGDGDKQLSEKYEKFKQRVYGFTYPIGKATGQLLDNLNPHGPAARNIKVTRK